VVGAGIAGLTVAYRLQQEGRKVIVLEDGLVASGETGRTSAHLANALDDHFYELERIHGQENAKLAAESHGAAIDFIEQTAAREGIECGFRRVDGFLFRPPDQDFQELEKEFAAAQRAGLSVSWADRLPWPSFDTGRALKFARQAQFHPLHYLAGLAKKFSERGGQIFGGTHVSEIQGGASVEVTTASGHRVKAAAAVVATNVPINQRVTIHTKQAAYRTYLLAVDLPKGVVPAGLYWDTLEAYHYLRTERAHSGDGEWLLVGGEDHKVGQGDPEKSFQALESWTRKHFPEMRGNVRRWSGQVVEPMDGMAFIGHDPAEQKNVYVVTGDSGNGLTHGTVAGLLLPDLIAGRPNRWEKLYDPDRVRLKGATEFVKENANVVPFYAEWLTKGDVPGVDEIAPGSGAVVRDGATKMAVYREADGKLCAMSAVCPHLGCIVRWNGTENSWDCPCHGSRFDAHGAVTNGPANKGLDPIKK
jgi:glycine/D-amino acid oxidase-like deaminating enzyme/nitrite reductase/ring-hydroxylating ferredoxin subunit